MGGEIYRPFRPLSGSGFLSPVPNLATLVASASADGDQRRVLTVRATYFAEAGSAATVDGISVLARTEGGRWIRSTEPDLSWSYQAAWFIDPGAGGNDENTGLTALTALKTAAELARRLDHQLLKQTTDVQVLGDLSEYIRLRDIQLAPGAAPRRLVVRSPSTAWTTLYDSNVSSGGTQALTAVTAINRATNTPQSMTDASVTVDPATFVGKRIRLTTGANVGATAWVLKKLTATSWRSTPFLAPVDPLTFVGLLGIVAPAIGDKYIVEDVVGCLGVEVAVSRLDNQDAAGAADTVGLVCDSLAIQKGTSSVAAQSDGSVYLFCTPGSAMGLDGFNPVPHLTRCWVHGTVTGSRLTLSGTLLVLTNATGPAVEAAFLNAGGALALTGTATLGLTPLRDLLTFLNDFCSQAVQIQANGPVAINGGLGIFDAPANAFLVTTAGATVLALTTLYGAGNAGAGVRVDSAHFFQYSAAGTKPTITGSVPGTNDATIGGVNKAWAAVPFADAVKMCGIVVT
jgi:hypothetical protein